jgi:hypothetical protein
MAQTEIVVAESRRDFVGEVARRDGIAPISNSCKGFPNDIQGETKACENVVQEPILKEL